MRINTGALSSTRTTVRERLRSVAQVVNSILDFRRTNFSFPFSIIFSSTDTVLSTLQTASFSAAIPLTM